jgi:hypothetical protein
MKCLYLCDMFAPWLRHIMMYIAGAVILLHSVLPHSHASDISAEENAIVYEQSDGVLNQIQLLLHDYEQLAETFVTRDSTVEFSLPAFIALVPVVATCADRISLDDKVAKLPLPIDDMRLAQLGNVNARGVRPPPVA